MSHTFRRAGEVVKETFPEAGAAAADPWIGASGLVAHPAAPLGGGGLGFFHGANVLGTESDFGDPVPHPQAPLVRNLDPILLDDKAEQLEEASQLPPPIVAADLKKTVNGIEITVKADKTNAKGISGANTAMSLDGGTTPDVEFDDKTKKITKILGPLPAITGTIETQYGSSRDGKSAYGRGTTDDDKKKGNTSLGFHESCHRQDHLDFVQANAPPKFGGKVGLTKEDWEKETDKYEKAVEAYAKKSDQNTLNKTDEVGNPTRSEYKKTHP